MLSTAIDSAKLMLAGKLFQDNAKVYKQLAIGASAGALVILIVGQFAPIPLAVLLGGGVAGFVQPILFKDLKYA